MKPHPAVRISDKTRIAIKANGERIPVLDAKFSFCVVPSPEDIEGAIPGSPTECMYCKACKRQFGSELVFVTRGLAYVELKNKFGKPELRRFILTERAKERVREFDNEDAQLTEEAIIFAAPSGSKTLEYARTSYLAKKAQGPKRKKPRILTSLPTGAKPKEKIGLPAGPVLRDKQTGRFNFQDTKSL